MKLFFTFVLFVSFLKAKSQKVLPDNFSVGNYLEVFGTDSIKVYFNCAAAIVEKNCAEYYRVGKIDPVFFSVTGEFSDYDMNGNIIFKSTIVNGQLDGAAWYYYKGNSIKEQGSYKQNVREGKWTFYYQNGKIEKIYDYVNGEPLILEAYNSKGTAVVSNGNGKIKTQFSKYSQCDFFNVAGELMNGKKHGKWTLSNNYGTITTEFYENGNFVKTDSHGFGYSKGPKIGLTKFYPHEEGNLIENMLVCGAQTMMPWKYNEKMLFESFYPELQSKLNSYTVNKEQWFIVGIKITKDNMVGEINVASSINDIETENYIHQVLSGMTNWKAAIINSKPKESNIFFSLITDNKKIIVPAYHFLSQTD